MKVLCDREHLREGLIVTTSVIPQKSTRPAVENVYIAAKDDVLELIGTDLDVTIRYRIQDVKVIEPGTALVPARVTTDFIRDLSGETVSLETQGETFVIESGSDHCELTTVDPDEFPSIAFFVDEGAVSVQAGSFTRLVGRTNFAAAKEQGRYAMHGILTMVEDGSLKMVATDGRRLAIATAPLEGTVPNGQKKAPRAIVPTKGMQLFCKVVDDPLEQIKMHFGEGQFGLKTEKAEVFARLIDGEYPRYSAVIPKSTENSVEADTELLHQKLRLVSNVTSAETRAVRISLERGQMKIQGHSAATGNATTQIEVDFDGTPGEIAFNPDYVIDGLKNCELERVRFEYNERTSPGKFTLGENYVYIVMPITIDS